MATSIFERAGAGAGDVTRPTARPDIRMAGIGDITAIARITQEGPQPSNVEPELLARATRLVLTHLAFEHGSLWVERAADGSIVRAVAAVPGAELSRAQILRRDVVPQLGGARVTRPPSAGSPKGFRAELIALSPAWILAEISKEWMNESGDPALLAAALRWTRGQTDRAPGPIAVLADTAAERAAAQWLGFVERRAWGPGSAWWLGVDPESIGSEMG